MELEDPTLEAKRLANGFTSIEDKISSCPSQDFQQARVEFEAVCLLLKCSSIGLYVNEFAHPNSRFVSAFLSEAGTDDAFPIQPLHTVKINSDGTVKEITLSQCLDTECVACGNSEDGCESLSSFLYRGIVYVLASRTDEICYMHRDHVDKMLKLSLLQDQKEFHW